MDSVTQAALGAAIGGAVLGRKLGRRAVLGGALLATLPDLDVLLDYGDVVLNFTQHRGFSHSLLVLLPLSWLLAMLLHRCRPDISHRHWWCYCGLILITHPLLDAFTTYGTQIWWPLGGPVSWHAVFIIDPLYTLPLLLAVLWALLRPPAPRLLAGALLLSCCYLAWSLLAQYWVSQRVAPVLAEKGLAQAPRLIQPMPFSTLLWRVTVLTDDQQLEIVTGVLDGDWPLTVQRFARDPELREAALQFPAARQLARFTGGFIAVYQQQDGDRQQLVVTDIRLGLPGAFPFHFVVAERDVAAAEDGWQEVGSYQLARPLVNPQAWSLLWQRSLALAPTLCLDPPRLLQQPGPCGPAPGE